MAVIRKIAASMYVVGQPRYPLIGSPSHSMIGEISDPASYLRGWVHSYDHVTLAVARIAKAKDAATLHYHIHHSLV